MRALSEHRREEEAARTWYEQLAEWMTRWSGSMTFLILHVFWFASWIAINREWTPLPAFDPFPFGLLTTAVSLEAIFLSTFVLISQNRQSDWNARQAELDLQINLLAEHELTRALTLLTAIASRLNVNELDDHELHELVQDVKPEDILDDLKEQASHESQAKTACALPNNP